MREARRCSSVSGRITPQKAYRNVTVHFRPCKLGSNCPHDREESEREAALQKKHAYECPSRIALHPIRRGSILNHSNQGWPLELLSERVDGSREVLKEHYDARSEEKARENRRKYM